MSGGSAVERVSAQSQRGDRRDDKEAAGDLVIQGIDAVPETLRQIFLN
jgi:hypothetical protein